MIAYLRVPWAFLVRDFREDSSYKIGFLFRVASAVINVAIYYFIASAFGSAAIFGSVPLSGPGSFGCSERY